MQEQKFLDFVSKISVMKPASIDERKASQVDKMNQILISSDYVAEEKIDGCHYMMFGDRFFSTEGVEKTGNYPHLQEFFRNMGFPNIILDGEINYPGRTSQYCTRVTGATPDVAVAFQQDNGPIHYTMWDMIRTPKGTWLNNQTYTQRRKTLEYFYDTYIRPTPLVEYIHLTDVVYENKKEYFDSLIAAGKEGCVLKNKGSYYMLGKSPMWQWMKLKQEDEADLFISGYEDPKVKYTGKSYADWPYWDTVDGELIPITENYKNGWIGSLILSAYVDGQPTVICSCSGFTKEVRKTISENKTSFINKVVKITFMEETEAGIPRHPRFVGFHESKQPHECLWDIS